MESSPCPPIIKPTEQDEDRDYDVNSILSSKRFTFQALRRLRSKTLIERGLPIKQYQEEMGHSYKTAMEHYLRYRPEEVLDML